MPKVTIHTYIPTVQDKVVVQTQTYAQAQGRSDVSGPTLKKLADFRTQRWHSFRARDETRGSCILFFAKFFGACASRHTHDLPTLPRIPALCFLFFTFYTRTREVLVIYPCPGSPRRRPRDNSSTALSSVSPFHLPPPRSPRTIRREREGERRDLMIPSLLKCAAMKLSMGSLA